MFWSCEIYGILLIVTCKFGSTILFRTALQRILFPSFIKAAPGGFFFLVQTVGAQTSTSIYMVWWRPEHFTLYSLVFINIYSKGVDPDETVMMLCALCITHLVLCNKSYEPNCCDGPNVCVSYVHAECSPCACPPTENNKETV